MSSSALPFFLIPLNMLTIFSIDWLLVGSVTRQKSVKYVDPTANDDVPEGPQPKDNKIITFKEL